LTRKSIGYFSRIVRQALENTGNFLLFVKIMYKC
jgi:hypothetical protein